jgi:hypothetical protein
VYGNDVVVFSTAEEAKKIENQIMSDYVNRQLRHASGNHNNNNMASLNLSSFGTLDYDAMSAAMTMTKSMSPATMVTTTKEQQQHGVCPQCNHCDLLHNFQLVKTAAGQLQQASSGTAAAPVDDGDQRRSCGVCALFGRRHLGPKMFFLSFASFAMGAVYFGVTTTLGAFVAGNLFWTIAVGSKYHIFLSSIHT